MNWTRLAAPAALCLLLAACTPAAGPTPTVAPAPTAPVAPPAPTPPWTEDYDLFWDTLAENYPLWAAEERIRRNDLEDVRARYRPGAEKAQSAQDLYTVLEGIMMEVGFTGHLTVHGAQSYASVMALYRKTSDGKCRYLYDVMDNPASRAFYGYEESEDHQASAGTQSTGEPSASGNLLFQYFPDQKAACVEILSMDMSRFDEDVAELTAFYDRLEAEGYEHCIVDIRRNGGGSSPYGPVAVAAPNLTEPVSSRHYALVRGGKEVLNYLDVVKDTWPLYPIEDLPVEDLPALHPDDLALATHFMTIDVGLEGRTLAETPAFTGRFWLLTSPRVYSASEYFAVFCKDTGFATLVGETTGGDGVGLNPLMCVLPNSGIVYQFSAENGLNLDGGCNEEMGTAPDIPIEKGQDALEVCLAYCAGDPPDRPDTATP